MGYSISKKLPNMKSCQTNSTSRSTQSVVEEVDSRYITVLPQLPEQEAVGQSNQKRPNIPIKQLTKEQSGVITLLCIIYMHFYCLNEFFRKFLGRPNREITS